MFEKIHTGILILLHNQLILPLFILDILNKIEEKIRPLGNSDSITKAFGLQKNSKNDEPAPYQEPQYSNRPQELYDKQIEVAEDITANIKEQCDEALQNCKYLDFFILLPKFVSLQKQTIARVKEYIHRVQQECNKDENRGHFFKDIQESLGRSQIHNHVIRLVTKTKKTTAQSKSNKSTRTGTCNIRNDADKLELLINRINEEEDTLFFIVVDEAHYGTTKGSDFNVNFNTEEMSKKNNVILLLVTATPYSLVTSNSRIPLSNRIDWFSNEDGNDMYYGIKDYLHYTAEGTNAEGHGLLSLDDELEAQITKEKESMLKSLPKRLASTRKDKENSVWAISRLKIIVLHYIQAMVGLYGEIKGSSSSKPLDFKTIFQWKIFNEITEIFHDARVTGKSNSVFRRMVNINDQGNLLETGSMCLLRVLRKEDGMFIFDTLIRLRKVLGMEDVFSLIMDGEEKTIGSVGVVVFNKN